MTTAFMTNPLSPPTPPEGWPIGSYDTYKGAQQAVDHLVSSEFPVQDVTIVGVEPMLVERVTGKLSWSKVLRGGAVSGAWLGLFIGLLLTMISPGAGMIPLLTGVLTGVGVGMGMGALRYAPMRGRHEFLSHSQFVAARYDVLCQPRNAEKGRDLLAQLAMRNPATN